jgi:hypothetical protein
MTTPASQRLRLPHGNANFGSWRDSDMDARLCSTVSDQLTHANGAETEADEVSRPVLLPERRQKTRQPFWGPALVRLLLRANHVRIDTQAPILERGGKPKVRYKGQVVATFTDSMEPHSAVCRARF